MSEAPALASALDSPAQQLGIGEQAVEGVVGRSPALSAWTEAQRAAMPDSDRLDWLGGQLALDGPEEMRRVIRIWPSPYQLLYLLDLVNGEVRNGGVSQFFFNDSGSLAPEVVAALREAGLPRHADAVQRGIDMFRAPYPNNTAQRRAQYFQHDGITPFDNGLDTLTGDVDDGAIGPAMIALAKRDGVMPH